MAYTQEPYWASLEPELLGEKLFSKVEGYGTSELTTGMRDRYSRAYQYYFGQDPSGVHATSQVLRGGEQGELAELRVNHSRPLVNTLLNLIVAPKIVWTPKAVNIDYDSVRECELAASVLEYYWSESQVAKFAIQALEEALVFSEGFILLEWDEQAGDDYGVDPDADGAVVKTGDVKFSNVSSWDVIRDSRKPSYNDLDWVMVRRPVNKFTLAAKFPEQAEDICSVPQDTGTDRQNAGHEETDDIIIWHFYHKRTAALPGGRQALMLADGTVLQNSVRGLEMDEWPLYRVSAAEMIGTPFGYTPYLEILGVQELMDSLNTAVATNQSTLATQCVAFEQGSEISPDNVGGMKAVYIPSGGKMPEALQLTKTPGEVFQYLTSLQKQQELLFGLNSVVRGEPQSGEQSGSALVHLSSQALQQASTTQGNWLRMVAGVGNGLLDCIKKKLSVEKKIGIVGESSQFLVEDRGYTGESFRRIKRVQVEIGNPMAQTTAGRDMLAKDYIQLGLIKTPEQLKQVHDTGSLKPLTQSLTNELLLIRSENEQMSRGVPQPVLALDDHMLHAREHRGLLANPQVRQNPDVVTAVLQHIAEHEQLYYTTSPATLMLVGQQPPPMPMGPGPGGPPPGGPGPMPEGPPPEAAGEVLQPPGNPNAGAAPPAPSPPKNPATGGEFNPAAGALPQ